MSATRQPRSRSIPDIEIEPGRHIQVESAVWADVAPQERGQAAPVRRRHACHPGGLGQHALQHQRVHVDQARLQQVQRAEALSLPGRRVRTTAQKLWVDLGKHRAWFKKCHSQVTSEALVGFRGGEVESGARG